MTTVDFKFAYVPADWVFDQTVVIIVPKSDECYAVLESSVHKSWAYENGSGFGSGGAPRYNPSRCFETFPFPFEASTIQLQSLLVVGDSYRFHRNGIMRTRQEGLTKTYERLHDREEKSDDIMGLRALQAEMDRGVADAYGWGDLELGHGFHETKQGVRYTISEPARRVVLDRLLTLNHERYAEEVAARTAKAVSAPVKRGRKRDSADKLTLDLL
jgi:hypothetical protein